MNNPKRIFIFLIIVLSMHSVVPIALAQGPGFDEDVEDAPFDGGVSILVAAATAYCIKKFTKRNNIE